MRNENSVHLSVCRLVALCVGGRADGRADGWSCEEGEWWMGVPSQKLVKMKRPKNEYPTVANKIFKRVER